MKKRYGRTEIIRMVAEKTGYHEHSIAEIHTALEEIVGDLLLSADEDGDVEVRVFFGLGLFSFFVPKHEKRMPYGKNILIEDGLRFTAKFSRAWKDSKITTFRETRKLWERVKRRNRK